MQLKKVTTRTGFWVLLGSRRSQAAAMNIAPGGKEGGPRNRHRGAEQWLYVLAGTGIAKLARRTVRLRRGTLLLIERGERHEIRNVGATALRTLNFYSPPAYTPAGNERPAAKP